MLDCSRGNTGFDQSMTSVLLNSGGLPPINALYRAASNRQSTLSNNALYSILSIPHESTIYACIPQHTLKALTNQPPDKGTAHADAANRYEQTVSCLKDLTLWPWQSSLSYRAYIHDILAVTLLVGNQSSWSGQRKWNGLPVGASVQQFDPRSNSAGWRYLMSACR